MRKIAVSVFVLSLVFAVVGCSNHPDSQGAALSAGKVAKKDGCCAKAAAKQDGCGGCAEGKSPEECKKACEEKKAADASGCGGAREECALEAGDGQGKIEWLANLPAALKVAAEEEKSILLFFDATWCAPSREMKRKTLADSRVAEVANLHFVRAMIDIDRNPEIADRYHVESVPSTIVLAHDGTQVARHDDVAGATAYAKILEDADVATLRYRDLKRAATAKSCCADDKLALAWFLHAQRSFDAAGDAYETAVAALSKESCCGSATALGEALVALGDARIDAEADGDTLDALAGKLEKLDPEGKLGFQDNAYFLRGIACARFGDAPGAKERFAKIPADSDRAEGAAVWGAWVELEMLGNRDRAAEILRDFVKAHPQSGYRLMAEQLLQRLGK